MASSERVYVAILVFSALTLIVNFASLLSQEKMRTYIDYLEKRVETVENKLKVQSEGMQVLSKK